MGRSVASVVLLIAIATPSPGAEDVVIVRNFPEVQTVDGTVSVEGPTRHTLLVPIEEVIVAPVSPTETTALVDGGILSTDGFVSVVLSLAGQIRADIYEPGQVGAILLPDVEPIVTAFREQGQVLLPLRVEAQSSRELGYFFGSGQASQPLAFPSYRVFFYNTTDRPAVVSLFAYLAN